MEYSPCENRRSVAKSTRKFKKTDHHHRPQPSPPLHTTVTVIFCHHQWRHAATSAGRHTVFSSDHLQRHLIDTASTPFISPSDFLLPVPDHPLNPSDLEKHNHKHLVALSLVLAIANPHHHHFLTSSPPPEATTAAGGGIAVSSDAAAAARCPPFSFSIPVSQLPQSLDFIIPSFLSPLRPPHTTTQHLPAVAIRHPTPPINTISASLLSISTCEAHQGKSTSPFEPGRRENVRGVWIDQNPVREFWLTKFTP